MSDTGASQGRLRGRTALVTGGAVRVGRAISLALAQAGMRVVVHYNSSSEDAERVGREIEDAGGEAALLQADLGDLQATRQLAADAAEAFGGVDVLINNASVFPDAPFGEVDETIWESAISVNLRAPFFLSQILGRQMKQRGNGVIINIADLAGIQAWNGYAAHGVAKAGLVHLTRIAARALAPEVRVAGIVPGTVLPPEGLSASDIDQLAARAPLRRIGSPADVTSAVLFLLQSEFITGHLLVVDGGRAIV